jgi:hypothetical protein
MGYYDMSLVCLNGHVITDTLSRSGKAGQKFCDKCGAATTSECASCRQAIRGDYHADGVVSIGFPMTPAPAYCYECGKPFPWTEARREAARELADDLSGEIGDADVATLKKSVDQVSTDTPMAEVGATRAKRILDKLGDSPTARALYRVFVDLASETAAKVLKP